MSEPRYRFGGPIPESVRRMKDRRVARENTWAQRWRTASRITLDRRAAWILSKDELAAAENQSPYPHGTGR